MQRGHPIAFLDKALGPKSRGPSTYEKECMAIIVAVQQWCSYLQHSVFVIITDHKILSQLSEQIPPWPPPTRSQRTLDEIGLSLFNCLLDSLITDSPVIGAVYAALKESELHSTDLLPY